MSDLTAAVVQSTLRAKWAAHLTPEQHFPVSYKSWAAVACWFWHLRCGSWVRRGQEKEGFAELWLSGGTCPVSRLQCGVNLLLACQTGCVLWEQLKAGFHGGAAGR